MRVLSLFDGMSCGQIALRDLGVEIEKYYASEIDKHAIAQTQLNFPETVQLRDVERWAEWEIDWSNIDLLLAGSPCQGFSLAGKQLAFDDPRSKLFFVFIDILNQCKKHNPDVKFLLENVNMKRAHLQIINRYCGVFPVRINSNLLSAQNRDRFYWTNIKTRQEGLFGEVHVDIPQPEDRGILLCDVLDEDVDEKYYLSDKMIECFTKHRDRHEKAGNSFLFEPRDINKKAACINTSEGTQPTSNFICVAERGRESACLSPKRTEYGKKIRKEYEAGTITEQRKNIQQLEPRTDGKTNTLTSVQKDNLIIQLNPCLESEGKQPYQQNRVYDVDGQCPALLAEMSCGSHAILQRPRGNNKGGLFEDKSPTVSACSWEQNNLMYDGYRIRRLTPTECSRLQTVPSWYRWECSDTQQYKMLGNGWTIEPIKHILKYLKTFKSH